MRRLIPLLVLAAGCGAPPAPPQPPEPPVVTVEQPVERTLDSFAEFTGYLRAVESQEIRAQVTGYLKEIKFTEGGLVKEGDVLYEIDPEPYDAALNSATSAIAKAKADVANADALNRQAQADFDRADSLRKTNAIAADEFDKKKASRDAAVAQFQASKASVDSAEASLRKAKFDRTNCTIKSDVKGVGRASRTMLTKGNLVSAGTTMLCTITSVDPIHVFWDVDEMTSLMYRRNVFDKKELPDPRDPNSKLPCAVGLKDEAGYPHPGVVDYIAPDIVRGTGTREVRGVIPNPGYRLTPGDSVRVKAQSGSPKAYLTVPEVAIVSQQGQKFVYVVGADKDGKPVAELRPVILGAVRQIDSGLKVQIIEPGGDPSRPTLTAKDKVIVNGLLRVRPGVVINPKELPLAAK